MTLKTRTFIASERPDLLPVAIAALDVEVSAFLATIPAVDVADVKTAMSPAVGHPDWPAVVHYVVTVIYLEA